MSNDFQKERLNCIRNEMTHIWGTAFLVGGSSITLILQKTMPRIALGIAGMLFTSILLYAYFIRWNETLKIVKSLEEK